MQEESRSSKNLLFTIFFILSCVCVVYVCCLCCLSAVVMICEKPSSFIFCCCCCMSSSRRKTATDNTRKKCGGREERPYYYSCSSVVMETRFRLKVCSRRRLFVHPSSTKKKKGWKLKVRLPLTNRKVVCRSSQSSIGDRIIMSHGEEWTYESEWPTKNETKKSINNHNIYLFLKLMGNHSAFFI